MASLKKFDGWNNAGTGHSALAESNYTPYGKDGKIDISKAIEINESFQITRQFLSWQVRQGVLKNPHSFINSTPHMSFMWGDDNVKFLKIVIRHCRPAHCSKACSTPKIRTRSRSGSR